MFFRNEDAYPKKILEKLQGFNRNAADWEWADLICWIQEFKSLIEKNQSDELPGPLILETLKSFSFCFKAGLPEGVQGKILEIFVLMGQSLVQKQKNLVVLSLLNFFQVCSNLVKVKILESLGKIIESFERFPVDSVVGGIFQGIEDKGEVFDYACVIVKKFMSKDKVRVCSALWKVVIMSKNNKMPALSLLRNVESVGECRELMLNGILSALYDCDLRAKRNALDLIKSCYPIRGADTWRADKVLLLKAALIVSDNREPTILRRLWEWIYPQEMEDEKDSISLLSESYLDIQATSPDKNLVIRTSDLILGSEFGEKFFESICLDLLIFTIKYSDTISPSLPSLLDQIKPIKFILLEKVTQHFEGFLQMSEELGYSILSFILHNKLQSGTFVYNIFYQLQMSFDYLENKSTLFNLLETLSIQINEIPPINKLSTTLIDYLSKNVNKALVAQLIKVLKNFENNGLDIESFLSDIKKRVKILTEHDKFRLIEFFSNFSKSPLISVEAQFLWKIFLKKDEAFEIILQMGKHQKELVNSGLLELLNKGKIGVQVFLKFWQRATAIEIIETLSNDLVSVIINLLENHDSLRPWIQSIDTKAYIVIDYLLVTILDPITLRMPANRIYVYENIFSHSSFSEKLKMLKSFLSNISYIAINSLLLENLTPRAQEYLKIHKIEAGKYMQALVKTLVFYMLAQPFDELTLLSIDCLELLTQLIPQNLINYIVRKGVRCLEHAIPQDNYTIQVSVMNLISPLLSKINEKYFIRLCDWKEFTNCLLSGCFSKEAIIRRLWRNTVIKSLEVVCRYSNDDALTQYYQALVKGISHYLVAEKDMSLITTLYYILNSVFQQSLAHVYKLVVRSFENIIRIAADFLMLAGELYQDRHPTEAVKELFACLVQRFPQELINSFILIWRKYCQVKPDYISVLLVLIQQFQLPLESTFYYILKFVQRESKDLKSNKEVLIFISFLLYKLMLETTILSHLVKNYKKLWECTIEILSELIKSPHSEVSALLLKIISVIQLDCQVFYNHSSKTQKKQVKELVGKLFECIFSNIFDRRRQCLSIPYPEFSSECEVHELCLFYMTKHAYDVTFFACLGEVVPCSLFLSNCCLNILFNLPSAKHGKRQALSFILSCLKYSELQVAEKIKKNVLELLYHDEFLRDSPECIRGFCQILHQTVSLDNKKTENFLKVFETYKDGWIFNRKDPNVCAKRISRTSLLILSAGVDEYSDCIEHVIALLNSAFFDYELFKFFCVMVKVLYLKLSNSVFCSVWKRFSEHFCVKALEYFELKTGSESFLELLKLVEFFVVAEFEEFFLSLFLFLPDVPNLRSCEMTHQYVPILVQKYFPNICFKAVWDSNCNNELAVCKRFVVSQDFSCLDELEKIIVSFAQACTCYSTQLVKSSKDEVYEEVEREVHRLFL